MKPFLDTARTAARYRRKIDGSSDRNVAIMGAWMAGARQVDLAAEYGLSEPRIWQIISPLRMRNLRFRRVK